MVRLSFLLTLLQYRVSYVREKKLQHLQECASINQSNPMREICCSGGAHWDGQDSRPSGGPAHPRGVSSMVRRCHPRHQGHGRPRALRGHASRIDRKQPQEAEQSSCRGWDAERSWWSLCFTCERWPAVQICERLDGQGAA